MELSFICNQSNPPAIHTLAKNYLDLFSKPLKTLKTKRKRLLYDDDRLVKILIVKYMPLPGSTPHIILKIDRLENFFQDLALVEKIVNDDFKDTGRRYHYIDDDEFHLKHGYSYPDAHEKLEELLANKDSYVDFIGPKAYDIMVDFAKQDIQKDYLQIGDISPSSITSLFAPSLCKPMPLGMDHTLKGIQEAGRNMIISPPLTLDLKHTPIEDGETTIFKRNVRSILNKFKRQLPKLFPLKIPVGVIVLYVPPETQSIDLDNLARYIIPFINDTLKPPMSFGNSIKSVTRYQFIELPRFDNDPVNGYVRLIFDNPDSGSIWDKIDKIIEKWEGRH